MSYTEVLQELTRDMVADNNMMSALQRREATLLGQENALSNQVHPQCTAAPHSLAHTCTLYSFYTNAYAHTWPPENDGELHTHTRKRTFLAKTLFQNSGEWIKIPG